MRSEDEKRFDVRIVDRNVRDGVIDDKDYETHLKALPDLVADADSVPYGEIVKRRVGRLAVHQDGAPVFEPVDDEPSPDDEI